MCNSFPIGAKEMGKISRIVGASLLLLICGQAQGSSIDNLSGIDVLSESHHVWGSTRTITQPWIDFSYDITSNDPVSFSTQQVLVNGQILDRSEAEAGNFRVQTDVRRSVRPGAYAQSTYRFSPEWTQLSLHAFGEGGGRWDSYNNSESIISLLDITIDKVLLSERFGEMPEDASGLTGWPYNFADTYLLAVNPKHIYELNLFSKTLGDENRNGATILQAELSAVPIPAAFWLFGSALIGMVGFGKRKKAA